MNTSLSRVIQVLGQSVPPRSITQQAFDYNTEHYQRLCHLGGAMPSSRDLYRYAEDMRYMPLQPDLLRYLLPICLNAWRVELLNEGQSDYAGFSEQFWTTLSPRPEAQGTLVLESELTAKECYTVMEFMRDSLLERMAQETQLHFVGSNSSPYQWFQALGSFCIVFPTLSDLWEKWWQMDTVGYAYCVLQYISCLMYRDDGNPVFPPWTPDKGGGPPELWGNANLVSCFGWRKENASFLAKEITLDYLAVNLEKAAEIIGISQGTSVPEKMLADWPKCRDLAASRIAELPLLVSQPESTYLEWSV
jgi:hypothetical protein